MESRHLFRGKRIDNGEWVEGYCAKGLDTYDKEIHIIFEFATIFYSSGEADGKATENYWKCNDLSIMPKMF